MSTDNADFLLRSAKAAGIADPRELANFMGQMQVESGGYARMSENLRYSGRRLLEVFPGRNGMDSLGEANRIAAGGPESVANAIYGGAWGRRNLGNIDPDDGWRYHGRGYVQLTGRANYARIGRELGLDLVNQPELAGERATAARIAIHYWKTRVVPNGHQHNVREATRDINGGYNHLTERRAAASRWEQRLERANSAADERQRDHLGPSRENAARSTRPSAADIDVRHLQRELTRLGYRDASGEALRIDGDFGQRTREALQSFQRAHGIDPVGAVGPRTRAALREAESYPTPVDPAHPDHALHRQSVAAVRRLDADRGHYNAQDDRLQASVTRLAKENGLARVDHVLLGNGNVFVVQGALDDPARRLAHMPIQTAMTTSAAEAFRQMAQHQEAVREQLAAPVRAAHFEHQEGLRRVPAP